MSVAVGMMPTNGFTNWMKGRGPWRALAGFLIAVILSTMTLPTLQLATIAHPLHIISNLSQTLLEDRIELPLSRQFKYFFMDPGGKAKVDKFDAALKRQGYEISRAENGRLRQLAIPLSEASPLDQRTIRFLETEGKLNNILEAYPDAVRYSTKITYGADLDGNPITLGRNRVVEIDFDKLPSDRFGLRTLHPDFAQLLDFNSRRMVDLQGNMGKIMAFFNALPRARFYAPGFSGDRIRQDVEQSRSWLGRQRLDVERFGTDSARKALEFSETNIKKYMVELTPRWLMSMFTVADGEEPRAVDVHHKDTVKPLSDTLNAKGSKIKQITGELLEPITDRIASKLSSVLGKSVFASLRTRIAAMGLSVAIPGVAVVAAGAGLVSLVCMGNDISAAIIQNTYRMVYAGQVAFVASIGIHFASLVTQLIMEGSSDTAPAEYLNLMVSEDRHSAFGRSIWGGGAGLMTEELKAQLVRYVPKRIVEVGAGLPALVVEMMRWFSGEGQADALSKVFKSISSVFPQPVKDAIAPICTASGYIADVGDIIEAPFEGLLEYVAEETLATPIISAALAATIPRVSAFFADQAAARLPDVLPSPEIFPDVLAISYMEQGNLFHTKNLSLQEPMSVQETRDLYIAQYLDRKAFGEDTTYYAQMFDRYSPGFLAELIASPAHADDVLYTPYEMYVNQLEGEMYGVPVQYLDMLDQGVPVYYHKVSGELTLNKTQCVTKESGQCLTLQDRINEELEIAVNQFDNDDLAQNGPFDPSDDVGEDQVLIDALGYDYVSNPNTGATIEDYQTYFPDGNFASYFGASYRQFGFDEDLIEVVVTAAMEAEVNPSLLFAWLSLENQGSPDIAATYGCVEDRCGIAKIPQQTTPTTPGWDRLQTLIVAQAGRQKLGGSSPPSLSNNVDNIYAAAFALQGMLEKTPSFPHDCRDFKAATAGLPEDFPVCSEEENLSFLNLTGKQVQYAGARIRGCDPDDYNFSRVVNGSLVEGSFCDALLETFAEFDQARKDFADSLQGATYLPALLGNMQSFLLEPKLGETVTIRDMYYHNTDTLYICHEYGTNYSYGSGDAVNFTSAVTRQAVSTAGWRCALCADYTLYTYQLTGDQLGYDDYILDPIKQRSRSPYVQIDGFKEENAYYPNGGPVPPQPGDLILFYNSAGGIGHVSLVAEVGERTVTSWQYNSRNEYHLEYDPATNRIGGAYTRNVAGWGRPKL